MGVTHGKPCVTMHASWKVYKRGRRPVRGGREEQKGKEKEKEKGEKGKKEREREGEERERERGRKGSRGFDGWNSSDQEEKSIYSMRATLQEVGILPTLIYFHPKGLFVKYGNAALF